MQQNKQIIKRQFKQSSKNSLKSKLFQEKYNQTLQIVHIVHSFF